MYRKHKKNKKNKQKQSNRIGYLSISEFQALESHIMNNNLSNVVTLNTKYLSYAKG